MSTEMRKRPWLLFIYSLPAQSKAQRVSVWRKLKRVGALQRISAYILPDEPMHFERFQWLAKQVRDEGGEASVIQTSSIDGLKDEDIVRLFQRDREKDYKELAKEIKQSSKSVKNRRDEIPAFVEKFRRRYQEIRSIDYFDSPEAHEVEALLQRVSAHFSRTPAATATILETKDFAGKTWMTRPRPEIDRVGSAWLIRKLIDPDAKFVFGSKPEDVPEAIPFDMSDVEFTHHGDDCTFETLLRRFRITGKPLKIIAEMIHDADLEDGKFGRIECVGIDLVLKGLGRSGISDKEILGKGFVCFDALYEWLRLS